MSDKSEALLVDSRVSWKVPTLLNNDWVALRLAQTLNPQLPKPLFECAYGCPPYAWAGGRPSKIGRTIEEPELHACYSRCAHSHPQELERLQSMGVVKGKKMSLKACKQGE